MEFGFAAISMENLYVEIFRKRFNGLFVLIEDFMSNEFDDQQNHLTKIQEPSENSSQQSQRIRKRRSKREKSRSHPEEEEEDPLQKYKNKALSGDDISDIPYELISPLIRELQEYRYDCLAQGEIDQSEIADKAMHIARDMLTDKAKMEAMNSRQQEINNRLIAAQNELAQLEETIERQEQNLHFQLEQKIIQLESKQQEEIRALALEWEKPERSRRYNRSSQQLRQLRAQAIRLLNSHRYDEMKVVERIAQKLEQDEVTAQRRQMENDFNAVLTKLVDRHSLEREKMTRNNNVKLGEYEAAKKFDLSVLNKRIQNLERELYEAGDSERVWNLYHRNDLIIDPKKQGCKTYRRSVEINQFSTLSLPPLAEPKSTRMTPAAALATKTNRYSPKTPRLTNR